MVMIMIGLHVILSRILLARDGYGFRRQFLRIGSEQLVKVIFMDLVYAEETWLIDNLSCDYAMLNACVPAVT